MDFAALERLFYQRHPQGSFELSSIRRVSAVNVCFKPGGLAYTYKGSAQSIAQEMKLVGVQRDLEGQAKLPQPVEGKYRCHATVAKDKFRTWVLTVTSPFTGQTLTIREGYRHLLAELWERIEAEVQQRGKRAGLMAGVEVMLTLEELKQVKTVFDQQQIVIAAIGNPPERTS